MQFNARAYRNALGSFPTGVVVVTAQSADRQPMGITVNSFASVSLEPPLVLWCVDRRSARFHTFAAATGFTISVLGATHQGVSARLAKPGAHRLDGIALKPTKIGAPALAEALAIFECTREAIYPGGDHQILVGRVQRFMAQRQSVPLVFFRGKYGVFLEDEPD